MPTEEERAIEYRRMMLAREAAAEARERALRGSEAARRTLRENWAPLELWLKELQVPTRDDEC